MTPYRRGLQPFTVLDGACARGMRRVVAQHRHVRDLILESPHELGPVLNDPSQRPIAVRKIRAFRAAARRADEGATSRSAIPEPYTEPIWGRPATCASVPRSAQSAHRRRGRSVAA